MNLAVVSNGCLHASQPSGLIIPWWSFTKTVLATVALSLVRDRKIGLDDKLPGEPYSLRQLLRHEAGLADYGELDEYHAAVAGNATPWSASEMLQRLDATRLRYAPGMGWRYSNVGYMYVANLIEQMTDLPLEEALAQRALVPLGLSRIRLARKTADLGGVYLGAAREYDPGWVYHGLLVGSLAEAALFLDGLLAGHLLPKELLSEMQATHKPGGPIPGRPWAAPGYGLGLMHGTIESGLTVSGHTGSGPGSVVAVHRCVYRSKTATCAVFRDGADQGAAEADAVERLLDILDVN